MSEARRRAASLERKTRETEVRVEIDLDGITDLKPGDFVEAQVTAADEYDLWAG